MLGVWWDMKEIDLLEVVSSIETIAADLFAQLLGRMGQALRSRGLETTTVKFLHYYTRPHVAKAVQEKNVELGWEVLPHPPYIQGHSSPD